VIEVERTVAPSADSDVDFRSQSRAVEVRLERAENDAEVGRLGIALAYASRSTSNQFCRRRGGHHSRAPVMSAICEGRRPAHAIDGAGSPVGCTAGIPLIAPHSSTAEGDIGIRFSRRIFRGASATSAWNDSGRGLRNRRAHRRTRRRTRSRVVDRHKVVWSNDSPARICGLTARARDAVSNTLGQRLLRTIRQPAQRQAERM